ncbi:MAG: peptide deformylase [Pseudomonadota bacterium]
MSIREILKYPDSMLSQPAAAVEHFGAELEHLIEDLIDTLKHHDTSIGLSAPQIGTSQRVIVVADAEGPLVFVNPTLNRTAVPCIVEERCLSLPELSGHVLRSAEATVSYQDASGRPAERELTGMPAVCLQHEIDHLRGRLFLERLTPIKQWWYKRGVQKRRQKQPSPTPA